MLKLPPVSGTDRVERRKGGRRAADGASASAGPSPVFETVIDPPEPAAERPEPFSPVERVAPRAGGRRKSDRKEAGSSREGLARTPKPHAPLVAQLIATALGVEQTRTRRRGTPEQAAELYRAKRARVTRRGEV